MAPKQPISSSDTAIGPLKRVAWIEALALGAIAAFWCWLFSSGALTSGYHLMDDHEIIRIVDDLDGRGGARVAWQWATNDFVMRFRPLFYFHRVLQAELFGDHFLAWSIYTALLGLVSSALLYGCLRLLRFAPWEGLAFAFFALVGEQGTIWWRLGVNETPGMVLLSLAAFAMAWHARTPSRPAHAVFLVSTALMTLCKESFIVLVPALLLGLVWAVRACRGISWARAARSCAADAIVLGAVAAAELLFLKLRVGTENIGYAGVQGLTPDKLWVAARTFGALAGVWKVCLALCALGLALRGLGFLRGLVPAAALCAAIVAPQAVVYAKTGVMERYYLPGVVGTAFFLAWCMRKCREEAPADRRHAELARESFERQGRPGLRERLRSVNAQIALGPIVALVLLIPSARAQGARMYELARAFGQSGEQRFLDRLTESSRDGPVLIVGGLHGVYEYFHSIHYYLEHKAHRGDEYFYYVEHEPLSEFAKAMVQGYRANGFYRKLDPAQGPRTFASVGILAGDEAAFLAEAAGWFDPAAYARYEVNGYTVYARR